MQNKILAILLIGLALCQPYFLYASPEKVTEKIEAGEHAYDAPKEIIHHISDANEFHIIGELSMPLPCILYNPGTGKVSAFLSSRFHHGALAIDGYVLDHGRIKMIQSEGFPEGEVHVSLRHEELNGEEIAYVELEGKRYEVERAGFMDFSISKVVFGMFMAALLMFLIFLTVAKGYKKREGQAPKGLQSFMEPLIIFVRDDIAKPNIGEKYEKYLPYLLSIFFFIWFNNMLGLIPFFPFGANTTGNLMVTLTLAVFTLLITNLSANKSYWQHIFWMPGVPVPVKILLAPIELIAVFTKPFALMVRLFANISAGHIIILSLISLIFIFGDAGQNLGGGIAGISIAVPFVLFMNLLELLVAFLQAFIFTILTALFIGQAVEEHH